MGQVYFLHKLLCKCIFEYFKPDYAYHYENGGLSFQSLCAQALKDCRLAGASNARSLQIGCLESGQSPGMPPARCGI